MSDDRTLFEIKFAHDLRTYAAAEAPFVRRSVVASAVAAGVASRRKRQWWRLTWPLKLRMPIAAAGSLAAAVLLVLFGLGWMFSGGVLGPGGSSTPTPTPTPSSSPAPSPRPAPDGDLEPGTYVAEPLAAAGNGLSVTFTVPEGWKMIGGNSIIAERGGHIVGIQLEDITSLNGDPCDWSGTADDVSAGRTVEELGTALRAHNAYHVSEPVDVSIGGYSGTRIDIVVPAAPFTGPGDADAPRCDDGRYRIWTSAVHGPLGVYAQGAANRWQTNILDVDRTRLVVIVGDFPETAPEDRAELIAIVDSMVITP